MAVALDRDEYERYYQYVLSAKTDPKKWRWSSPDQAGTKPPPGAERISMDSSQVLDKAILGMSKGKMHKGKAQKVRNPMTFLQNARYKPVKKYTYPDGRVEYRDEDGNKVQPPKKEEFHALAEVEP